MTTSAAVFPGQGVQEHVPSMSRQLLEADPSSESTYLEAAKYLGRNILKICLNGDEEELGRSQNLQPAVAVASVAALRSLERLGFQPNIVAGHSLGEYPALYAARAITFESMCRLVAARAKYMEEANHESPGRMAAIVSVPLDLIKRVAKDTGVDIAVHNILQDKKEQIVLSGSHPAIEKALKMVEAIGQTEAIVEARRRVSAIHLDIPYAAHSREMLKARKRMTSFIKSVPVYDPEIGVVSNGTGRYFEDAAQIRRDLPRQLTQKVLWDETMRFMQAKGVGTIYEVGPGSVLSGINKQILGKEINHVSFDPSLKTYNFTAHRAA